MKDRLLENVPRALLRLPRWVPWVLETEPNGKQRKRPLGSTLDRNFPRELERVEIPAGGGIGFVTSWRIELDEEDGGGWALCLDLDACRDPQSQTIATWALDVWRLFDRSYTELSVSGSGLHLWFAVDEEPKPFPKIPIFVPALPKDVNKKVEIQGFGTGAAGYVTMTGRPLTGSRLELARFPNLDRLFNRFDVVPHEDTDGVELPIGRGPVPDLKTLEDAIEKAPSGETLLAGDWETLGYKSASEAWSALVHHGLAVANGHAQAVADVLSTSAWGRGEVDSVDPGKYASERWVTKDIKRLAVKLKQRSGPPAHEVFEPCELKPAPTPKPEPKRRPRILHAKDYVEHASEDLFLVYKMLPKVGVARIFGDPGSGKTPVAMSLAVSVSQGASEWWGHEIDTPGAVVYMVGEGAAGISNRLTAQLGGEQPDTESKLFLTTEPGQLTDPENVELWKREIRSIIKRNALPGVSLLVVDTQDRNFGPGDENATQDGSRFVNHCADISREFDCLVLLVHHTGQMHKDRARGSSVIFAGLDAEYRIERIGRTTVTATATKAKDFEDDIKLRGQLLVRVVGEDRKGREVTAVCFDDTDPNPAAVFEKPRDEHLEVLATLYGSQGEAVTLGNLAKATGYKRTTVQRFVRGLLDLQLVAREKMEGGTGHRYLVTERGREALAKADVIVDYGVEGLLQ